MRMAVLRAQPLSAVLAEREGPAKREGEVGAAANRHVGPSPLPSPPAGQRGERVK